MQSLLELNFWSRAKKPLLVTMLVLLAIASLLGIYGILFVSSSLQLRLTGTAALLGLTAFIVLCNATPLSHSSILVSILASLAIIAGFAASILLILILWGVFDSPCHDACTSSFSCNAYTYYDPHCYNHYAALIANLNRIICLCFIATFNATVISRFLTYKSNSTILLVSRGLTIACSVFLWITLSILFTINTFPGGDFWKLLLIMLILFTFGLIATPILAIIERHRDKQSVVFTHEQALRSQIEREVRAKIAAESAQTPSPSVPPTKSKPTTESKSSSNLKNK